MSQKLNDYGGNNYNGKTFRTKRAAKNLRSYRCLDCGKLFYLSHRSAGRARGPHCDKCGGPGEETVPSFERRTGLKKADVARLAGRLGKIDTGRRGARRFCARNSSKPFQCLFCGEQFRNEVALKLHQEDHPDHLPAS